MAKDDKEVLERLLSSTIENICTSYLDEFNKANAELSAEIGLKAYIIREEVFKCCDWCHTLAGKYEYGTEPKDIYRRHDNCKCMVLFKRGKEPFQNVHSKKKYRTYEDAMNDYEPVFNEKKRKRVQNIIKETNDSKQKNVRMEYMRDHKPGEGVISYEEGYKPKKHKEEIDIATWLKEQLGGDILCINEKNEETPDYIWRGKMWELKTPKTLNGIDKLVHKGLRQISKNPGGLIIDLSNFEGLDALEAANIIEKRIVRSAKSDIDVLLKRGDKISAIVRIKK